MGDNDTPFEQEMRAHALAGHLHRSGWLAGTVERGHGEDRHREYRHADGRHFGVTYSGVARLTDEAMSAMAAALDADTSPPGCPLAFAFSGERGVLSVTVGPAYLGVFVADDVRGVTIRAEPGEVPPSPGPGVYIPDGGF